MKPGSYSLNTFLSGEMIARGAYPELIQYWRDRGVIYPVGAAGQRATTPEEQAALAQGMAQAQKYGEAWYKIDTSVTGDISVKPVDVYEEGTLTIEDEEAPNEHTL